MKKLFLFFFALVVSIGTSWADKTIYFEPNQWDKPDVNEYFAAYAWGGSSPDEWYDAEAIEGTTYYKFTIPDDRTGLLFTRAESEENKHVWGATWNQTNDINLSSVTDNAAFIFTSWGDDVNKSTVVSTSFSPYTVTFATKSAWANVYAYTYDEKTIGEWPGKKMTATGEKVYDLNTFAAHNIYSISFLATAAPSKIIFDNGGNGEGNQTGNLDFTNGKFYLDGIQENLAYGAAVSWGDDANHTEKINGSATLSNLTDGNDGTNVQVIYEGENTVLSVVLDLGSTKTFNSLLINQTGDRNNTAFQIFVSDDNASWTAVETNSTGVNAGRFIATFTAQTARYVKYVSNKNDKNVTDQWGAGLAEIQIYNLDEVPSLSSLTLSTSSTSIVTGNTANLAVRGMSSLEGINIGVGTITWNNDNTTAGTIADGVYTGAAAGTSVISATVGEITSNTVSITVLAAPTEPTTPVIDENKISIYIGDDSKSAPGLNKYRVSDYQGDGWTRKALKYDTGHNVEFTMNALNVSEMSYLHVDVFPNEATTLAVFVNGTGTNWNGYDLNNGNEIPAGSWYSEDIPISFFTETCSHDMSTLTNIVFCKTVADKTGHAGFSDFPSPYKSFVIGNIYAYKNAAKTVTFVNDGNWENVHVWAWKGTDGQPGYENFTGGEWPGVTPVDNGDGTYTWSTTGDPEFILFNNGSNEKETPDFPFVDGTTYNSTSIPASVGYYIVGTMNGWAIDKSYKLTLNETAAPTVEYYFPSLALTTTSEFKVAHSSNGFSTTTIYPDGSGNAYGENGEIASDGNYVIFFRPNGDGGIDWFNNVIYVTSMIDAGVDPTTGAHILTGVWDADKFASIDAMDKANSYDLTGVDFTGVAKPINMVGKTANPYCMFITSAPGEVNRNEVVWDATNNRYNGFAMILEETTNDNKTYDINTSIKPIHVTNPIINRFLPAGLLYTTVVLPFDYPSIPNPEKEKTKVYAISSSSTTAGGTTVTFTEVNSMEAGKPYLINSFAAVLNFNEGIGTVDIDWTTTDEKKGDATAVGTFEALTLSASDNAYVLPGTISSTGDLSFQKAGNVSVRPFRAYITVPVASGAKINVVFDDATGIHAATTEQLEGIFNIYSIDGKLVRQNTESKIGLEKGIYIINGKKVVIK